MNGFEGAPFLFGPDPLSASDAVAALILVEDEGYLMQKRDRRPDIWYPDHWGLFGGGVEPGEEPTAALVRELREELELTFADAAFLFRFDFDLSGIGLGRYFRSYYTVPITRAQCQNLVLHEGATMRVFAGVDIVAEARVSPYDHFALFLHHSRARLAAPPRSGA
jgi:8-oxo-dGTP pyrophosphatase MutT (NUDIX family)